LLGYGRRVKAAGIRRDDSDEDSDAIPTVHVGALPLVSREREIESR